MKNKSLMGTLAVLVALCFAMPAFASPQKEASKSAGLPEMVTIVKLKSPWFNNLEKGVLQANTDFGINGYMLAPASPDPAQQVKMVEDAISKGVKAILVVPNDAKALEPVFAKARAKGIVIITHESPNQKNNDYNVEMADLVPFGQHAIEKLVEYMGSAEGEYAIFVGSLTVPNHNIWADACIALAKEKYPKLTLVADRFPVAEDLTASRQKMLELITAYPKLRGLLVFGSQGGPGAAEAVREKGLQNQIMIVGPGAPQQDGQYFDDGSIKYAYAWSPKEAGYVMEYVAKQLIDGKKITNGMDIPNIGKLKLDGSNILYNRPLGFTKANWKEYDF